MAHLPHPVTAEHIGYAVIRLHEIEATKPHGGKRGRQLVDLRLKQKAHINELLAAFGAEDRRLDGRPDGLGSMTSGHVDTPVCERKREHLENTQKSQSNTGVSE